MGRVNIVDPINPVFSNIGEQWIHRIVNVIYLSYNGKPTCLPEDIIKKYSLNGKHYLKIRRQTIMSC